MFPLLLQTVLRRGHRTSSREHHITDNNSKRNVALLLRAINSCVTNNAMVTMITAKLYR